MRSKLHPIAAITFDNNDPVDKVFDTVAARLVALGYRVEGFLQRETATGEGCCSTMHLASIADGSTTTISQQLGKLSRGCRLDPQALAELSGPLTARLEAGADLLIINRFGKGESLGAGFRSAIAHAVLLGIPVLTAVREAYWDAWQDYTGGAFDLLHADAAQVEAWALAAIAASREDCKAA